MSSPLAMAAVPKNIRAFPEGERLVYTRLVQSFRQNQLAQVLSERQVLERNYPLSVHLDNAYYLSGMLEFQNMKYAEALKDFDVVRYRYNKSNKRPGALLATAVTYDKLNLAPQANRVYSMIIKEYPGSPEAQRAWMHLKLEKTALKRR
jgi:TolA-binding protein